MWVNEAKTTAYFSVHKSYILSNWCCALLKFVKKFSTLTEVFSWKMHLWISLWVDEDPWKVLKSPENKCNFHCQVLILNIYPHNWNNHSLSKDTLETLIVLFHRSHIAFLMSIMQWLWVLSKMLTYIHLYLFSSLRYDFNMPAGSYGNLVGSCFQEKKNTTAYQKKGKAMARIFFNIHVLA